MQLSSKCQKLLQVLEGCNYVFLELSLFQAKQTKLPQLAFIEEVPRSSDHLQAILWAKSNSSTSD